MRTLEVTVALALASGCAGAPRAPWADQQVCGMEEVDEKAPTPEHWTSFLVRGVDPRTQRATVPAIDCAGAQVTWEGPGLACADNTLAQTLLPGRALSPEDVAVSPAGEGVWLVWVMTNRYASGEALGPVGLVTRSGRQMWVRALGALRAFPVHPRLRLERVGDVTLLVAEGEVCGPGGCERGLRVMSLKGDRFVPERFLSEAGACEAPGFIFVQREAWEELSTGWRRRHELSASVAFQPARISVQELLVVRDADPRNPTAPGRVFRRAEDQLTIAWKDGRLVASGSSLWARMRGRP